MAPKGRRGRGNTSSANSRKEKDRAIIEVDTVQIELSTSSTPSTSDHDRLTTTKKVIPIMVHGQKYYKAEDLARKGKGRKKTSHIWEKGFEIIHADHRFKYYYCRLCFDEKRNPIYILFIVDGNSLIHAHFRFKHKFDRFENAIGRDNFNFKLMEFIFKFAADKFKLFLIKWIVFCHIAFV